MNKDELKKKLNETEYHVTQEKGTEAPYSGEYWKTNDAGMYACKVCGQKLFASDTKLNSAEGPLGLRGWPAFDNAIPGSVEYIEDNTMGMHRTEVVCSKCKSHLRHLFDDEHAPSGKHFCVNSCSIDFEKKE